MSHLDQYLKSMKQDVTFTALQGLYYRRALVGASSENGLVSLKLHRIRDSLERALSGTVKVFDETAQRCAKKGEKGDPVMLAGKTYNLTLTQAYESDPEQVAAMNEALKPIYEESITVKVAKLTAFDSEWIRSKEDIGFALDPFTEDE